MIDIFEETDELYESDCEYLDEDKYWDHEDEFEEYEICVTEKAWKKVTQYGLGKNPYQDREENGFPKEDEEGNASLYGSLLSGRELGELVLKYLEDPDSVDKDTLKKNAKQTINNCSNWSTSDPETGSYYCPADWAD